jgi:hypothetical protein
VDLSEINEVVYWENRYFEAVVNVFAVTMQRAVGGNTLGITDILRNG